MRDLRPYDRTAKAGFATWRSSAMRRVLDRLLRNVPLGPSMRQAAVERRWPDHDLRRALAHEDCVLLYQPVVDLRLGRVVGAEALIRRQHRFQDPMDPDGRWLLRRACLQIGEWNDSGLPGLKVAVTLTAAQVRDPSLLPFVREALRTCGIAPGQLEIALAETAAMADPDHSGAVFGALRDLGLTTAIAAFGTGSASLGDLRKLPLDKLKFDRAAGTAPMALARGLGVRAQGEGAETEDDIRFLHAHGCELYHGPYVSRPLPATDFRATLRYVSRNAAALADSLEPPVGSRHRARAPSPSHRVGEEKRSLALSCPAAPSGR